jgi:hypothetical protein
MGNCGKGGYTGGGAELRVPRRFRVYGLGFRV